MFVYCIRNPDIKISICYILKRNFAETVIALAQEKHVSRENKQKAKPKCFNCRKGGHFQRNCTAPRIKSKTVSPTIRRAVATSKTSGIHYVEKSSYNRIGGKPQDSENHPKAKVPKIEPNKQIGKFPNTQQQQKQKLWKLKRRN